MTEIRGHKFSKNVAATFKFQAPEGWHQASCLLSSRLAWKPDCYLQPPAWCKWTDPFLYARKKCSKYAEQIRGFSQFVYLFSPTTHDSTPIPAVARSKAWVYGRSLAGIVGSNPPSPGTWRSVCCECCILSDRGLCVGLITRPEESYRVWCVSICSWSFDKEEALGH